MKISDKPQPLITHIRELRKRCIVFLVAWGIGTLVSYCFCEEIFGILLLPFKSATPYKTHSISYFALTEAFTTYLKIAFWAGSLLSSPIFAYEVWQFIVPGLKPREKKALKPFFYASPFLFLAGALFAYFLVIPLAWSFFLSFESASLPVPLLLEARMSEYFSLTLSFLVAFGLSFQFPLVLIGLAHMNLLSSRTLVLNRKYAIILIFIVAALLTPPDVLSQVLLAIPLMLLFEGALWIIRRHEHSKPLTYENLKDHV